MEQPPGFAAQGESSALVCRLRKSLYGLKQSPRVWIGKFSNVFHQFGMTRCEADHSVFYRHSSAGCVYLIMYVDDIVLTGSDNHDISQMKQHLCDHFRTKDLGKLRYSWVLRWHSPTKMVLLLLNESMHWIFWKKLG